MNIKTTQLKKELAFRFAARSLSKKMGMDITPQKVSEHLSIGNGIAQKAYDRALEALSK